MEAQQLNRATLDRQLLLQRQQLEVTEAVSRVVGLQAQEPASPYVALWNRIDGFDPASLDAAFREKKLVRASLLRVTLHAVAARDYPTWHEAMLSTLRASRLNDRRFRETGLSIDQADALVPGLVEFTQLPRTGDEIQQALESLHGEPLHERVWWALRTYAPVVRAPSGGPWSFDRETLFMAAPRGSSRPERFAAIRSLFLRYLAAFGPASVEDFAHFVLHRRSTVREALDGRGEGLIVREGPDGKALFDLEDSNLPDPDIPAPVRLLGMWDNVLLAHLDRSRVIPDDYRSVVIRRNGDVLPALLVDGYVAGVWRPLEDGIEVTAFRPLDGGVWEQIAEEAQSLRRFLAQRQDGVYRRYGRWWDRLPGEHVKVLSD